MAPEGKRSADGTSAQLTNQLRPDAIVFGADHPEAVRSANFSVARSPLRSIQLRSTPRLDTDSCGCAEFAAAGVAIDCGVVSDV
jgi:hypothetical protein